jgi:hypothetical protein
VSRDKLLITAVCHWRVASASVCHWRVASVLIAALVFGATGCSLIVPEIAHQPVIRNPFPQLSRVAVAPFFNQSDEATLDSRKVSMAYFAELQATPGFEVVPLGVVEEAIIAHRVDLSGPGEARRLAQILGVDAVAVGSITDFAEYYPPRLGLRVEWYTANPGFHEIPAGYGLPWGTPEEEFIPDSLVYESQMALAKAQMAPLSPDCDGACQTLPAPPEGEATLDDATALPEDEAAPLEDQPADPAPADAVPAEPTPSQTEPLAPPQDPAADYDPFEANVQLAQAEEPLPAADAAELPAPAPQSAIEASDAPTLNATGATGAAIAIGAAGGVLAQPPVCDDGACPPTQRPPCNPNHGPVLVHTRIYHGNDGDVVEALKGYVSFRDEDRFGGWKSYLERSDDFIRFCCRMHISEMLSARGGSRKTQVVWRWPESR